MKMTKKLFMVAIATAAFALTSCGMGAGTKTFDKEEKDKPVGNKKGLTIGYKNIGDCPRYKRVWEQLGTKETVQALETTITIDVSNVDGKCTTDGDITAADTKWFVGEDKTTTKESHAVVGLIFDLHETTVKDADGKDKKVNDFVLIGYRPYKKSYYVERYSNVPKEAFDAATNDSSFSDAEGIEVEYLASKSGKTTSSTVYYIENATGVTESHGKLGEDKKGNKNDEEVDLQSFTVSITQETKGTYLIKVFGEEFEYTPLVPEDTKLAAAWYTKDKATTKDVDEGGYRIGGAGYYVNVPVGTGVKANFDSDNDNTIGLEEEVDE